MINIVFLMNGAKPPRGGEFLTLYLVTHLRKDTFHPILVYVHKGVIVQELIKDGIDAIRIHLSDTITNIYPREIKLFNIFLILKLLCCLLFSGRVPFKLSRLLKKNDVNLIYCADNLSKLIGGIAGKMANVKVVAHCHDDFKEDILGKTMRAFYLLLLDRIITVSEKVRNFFTAKGEISSKAITVYNGISSAVFNPNNINNDMKAELGFKDDDIVIGSIGTLEKDKGQKDLLEAIARLKLKGITNIMCVICGIGPEELNLKELVQVRGLANEVLFLGFRGDIPMIMKALDLIVITSLTIESFSMIAVEGMAMEVPVVATNVGGLPEVVDDGKTGILVPPGNVDALCKAITHLIENPELRLRMGRNGRSRVLERFTIEENVRKTEEVFMKVLEGN